MAEEFRGKSKFIGHGPFLAIVRNHLDPTYMGGMEVTLIRRTTGSPDIQGQTVQVRYLSPFYGVTNIDYEGTNSANFQDVQKSYGFWAVPPDIGTTVLVIFIDGDMNNGFWIGCVQDRFANQMVPGLAATDKVEMTPEQERKYGTRYLPTAEFSKKTRTLDIPKPDSFGRPVHPFADRLLAEGLLLDTVRGVTSSSARRETPSQVFGISTPGPMDTSTNARKATIGYDSKVLVPVSRLGGSTFVMDDGDKEGKNELVRLRTRTGHQILLHNSADLIYIANAAGTAWLEMSSNGKIDIYAADSVSIHSENDFNFRADRDINLEAGRDINISTGGHIQAEAQKYVWINSGDEIRTNSKQNTNILAGGESRITSSGDMSLLTNSKMKQAASGQFTIGTGANLIMNGSNAYINSINGDSAVSADPVTLLSRFSLPNRSVASGWSDGKFYAADPIRSIMQRVPTHEPYDQHENVNPTQFTPTATDSSTPPDQTTSVNKPEANKLPVANPGSPPPNGAKVPDWGKDIEWLKLVRALAAKMNCTPLDLLGIIMQESGMNPAAYNPQGPAYGLIQWTKAAAGSPAKFGYTIEQMATLTRVQQMPVMEYYFQLNGIMKLGARQKVDITDLYSAVFFPAGIGKPLDYKAYGLPGTGAFLEGRAYVANKSLDKTGKGYITKNDYSSAALSRIPQVQQVLANQGFKDDLSNVA